MPGQFWAQALAPVLAFLAALSVALSAPLLVGASTTSASYSYDTVPSDYDVLGHDVQLAIADQPGPIGDEVSRIPSVRFGSEAIGGIHGSSAELVAPNGALDDFFDVTTTGGNRAGTLVPESFDIAVSGQRFSVHPNATKHMAEYATSLVAGVSR